MNRSGLVRFVVCLTVILELSIFVRSTSPTGKQRFVLRSATDSDRDILAEDSYWSDRNIEAKDSYWSEFRWGRAARTFKSLVKRVAQSKANAALRIAPSGEILHCTGDVGIFKHGEAYRSHEVVIGFDNEKPLCLVRDAMSPLAILKPVLKFKLKSNSFADLIFTGKGVSVVTGVKEYYLTNPYKQDWTFNGIYTTHVYSPKYVPKDLIQFPQPKVGFLKSLPTTEVILLTKDLYPMFHCYTKKSLIYGRHVVGKHPDSGRSYPLCSVQETQDSDTAGKGLQLEWTAETSTELFRVVHTKIGSKEDVESELENSVVRILNHEMRTFRTMRGCNLELGKILTCSSNGKTLDEQNFGFVE